MPPITNNDRFPVGEHDIRCLTWTSDDPDDCDCRDADGHAPPVRWADSPTIRAAMNTQFPCDDDLDEATS